MKVYLAGAINGCSDDECKTWREEAKRLLADAAECLDPMTRDYRGQEAQSVAQIVEGDKADIDECDVVLVYFTKPSVGTSMEVLYAWEWGKRVVIVAPNGIEHLSPWLVYHSTRQVASITEACIAIGLMAADADGSVRELLRKMAVETLGGATLRPLLEPEAGCRVPPTL